MTSVSGLSRIVLICRDVKRLASFYAGAFGFAPVDAMPQPDPVLAELIGVAPEKVSAMTLRLGAQTVVLAQTAGDAYPGDVPGWDTRFQHFAIVVSDMGAAYAALAQVSGWTAISTTGPQRLPKSSGGVSAFKFRDPEGHPLELLAFPPDATPAVWRAAGFDRNCLGIDHSAISVRDTARSIAFFSRLGLVRFAGSLNSGPEQQNLDGIADAVVEVTALGVPEEATPHVELLCYRGDFARRDATVRPADVAATQLVFGVARDAFAAVVAKNRDAVVGGPFAPAGGAMLALLRDPDGHLLCLEALPHD